MYNRAVGITTRIVQNFHDKHRKTFSNGLNIHETGTSYLLYYLSFYSAHVICNIARGGYNSCGCFLINIDFEHCEWNTRFFRRLKAEKDLLPTIGIVARIYLDLIKYYLLYFFMNTVKILDIRQFLFEFRIKIDEFQTNITSYASWILVAFTPKNEKECFYLLLTK